MAKAKSTSNDATEDRIASLKRLENDLCQDVKVGRAWGTDPASVLVRYGLAESRRDVDVEFYRFEGRKIPTAGSSILTSPEKTAWCGCGKLCSLVLEGMVEFESGFSDTLTAERPQG